MGLYMDAVTYESVSLLPRFKDTLLTQLRASDSLCAYVSLDLRFVAARMRYVDVMVSASRVAFVSCHTIEYECHV